MAELGFDGNAVFNGVLASAAFAVTWWAVGKARTRVGLMNDRLSLRILRWELRKVETVLLGPTHTAAFLMAHAIVCFALLGVGVAFAPIAFMEGGEKWIGPGLAVVGLTIYCCAIYPLGILFRASKGEPYLSAQRSKIVALEKKLGRIEVEQGRN